MVSHRRIVDLESGEAAYTPPAAAWVEGDQMYLNGNLPISEDSANGFTLRLIKSANGWLAVDLSGCRGENFYRLAPFKGQVIRVHVDEALPFPGPDASCQRIADMEPGDIAYVSQNEVWVHNRLRMFLNGYTPVSDKPTGDNLVQVTRLSNGSYGVSLQLCPGATFPRAPRVGILNFPIQVLRRID